MHGLEFSIGTNPGLYALYIYSIMYRNSELFFALKVYSVITCVILTLSVLCHDSVDIDKQNNLFSKHLLIPILRLPFIPHNYVFSLLRRIQYIKNKLSDLTIYFQTLIIR